MRGDLLRTKFLSQIRQAVVHAVHVGVIDLIGISGEDELGAFSRAGQNRFDLVGRQVLRFINDDQLLRDGPSADIRKRFDFQ